MVRALFLMLIGALIVALILIFLILPSINWSATRKPGQLETRLADYVMSNWVGRHAAKQTNPINPTPENLKAGQGDFEEHCATCHGLDGSGENGENRFEADFYPPVPKLTEVAQEWSDGELYFIISNGIALSGMPAFGKKHDSKDIWGMVLWVRHLAQLSPAEKAALESRAHMSTEQHQKMMEESHPQETQPHNPAPSAEPEHHH
ncbi:MAG TPA: cytochrome c [Candidatus Dormibacteraeota bacterium]|nr:cytochrome c [Candidatus Dormibacteraeota bacterium]